MRTFILRHRGRPYIYRFNLEEEKPQLRAKALLSKEALKINTLIKDAHKRIKVHIEEPWKGTKL